MPMDPASTYSKIMGSEVLLEEGDLPEEARDNVAISSVAPADAVLMKKETTEGAVLSAAEMADIEKEDKAQERDSNNRLYCLLGIFAAYVVLGIVFYTVVEGWSVMECVIVILSIVSGVGYGHIVPKTDTGMCFTSVYIFAGLTLFGVLAGKILDSIVGAEIAAMTAMVKDHMSGANSQEAQAKLQEEQRKKKRAQFIVGLANVSVLCISAMLFFTISFKEGPKKAMYLAAVSALKMDSLCAVDSIHCSKGAPGPLAFTVVWYMLTYTIVAHFMVSTSSFLGMDSDGALHIVKHLNSQNLKAMDADGDGNVSRSEFLRAQLIENNLVEQDVIDTILNTFDLLDKDGSGELGKGDLG